MARDLPYVGVSIAPQISPNSNWYLNNVAKSNINRPLTAAPSSFGTAIGSRTYSFNTRRGRQYELGRIESGEANLSVDNSDGLFDPNNSSSAFYPNVVPYRPININCAYPLTGNILNDTNLAPVVPANAPATTASSRVSVGANDGNFDLGVISNWHAASGNATTIVASTTFAVSGTYSMRVTFSGSGAAYLDVPVVAGKQITVSLSYRGNSNTFAVKDGSDSGIVLNTQTVLNATGFTRYTATVTPQTSKITISVGGTNSTFYVDNVQVEFGASASTYATTGPTIYNLFRGFVERYPQTYQAPNRGQTNMVATDALASISNVLLTGPYEANILQDDNNIYYYPFSEPSGSVAAYNAGLYNQPSMKVSSGASALVAFGDASAQTGISGAGTTGVTVTGSSSVTSALQLSNIQDLSFNAASYTVSFWIKLAANNLTGGIFDTNNLTGSNGLWASLYLNAGNFVSFINTGTNSSNVASAVGWNFVSLNIMWQGSAYSTSVTVSNVNGTVSSATSGSWASTVSLSFSDLALRWGGSGTVTFAHLSINRGSISPSLYYSIGATALSGESTGTRFSDLVNLYSGFSYLPYSADYGKEFMQGAAVTNVNMFEALQTIADTEGGTWYVDSNGYATFKDRWNRLQKLVPSVIFGDGAGETAYDGGDLTINYDPTYVINQASVTRLNGVSVSAQDQTSVANYFPRSYDRTIQNLSDSTVSDAAYFILSRYKDPHARPEQVKLTPARNPSIWATALGLEIGDLVRVNKRPLGAPAISIDCFIERIEHSFDAVSGDWITTVTLSPTIVYYWNLAAMRATTSGAAVSGSYVFTKSATTGAGLNSGRDIRAGQMLQYTSSGTTYIDVVSGAITENATTVTVPALRVGTFTNASSTLKTSTLSSNILMDSLPSAASLNDGNLNGTSGLYLIDEEIVSGSVSAGTVFTITARAQNTTIQTAQGSGTTAVLTGTYSHFSGATVTYIAGTAGGNVAASTVVTEVLPNQLTQIPYSVPTYTSYDTTSVLKSWTGVLTGAPTATTVSSLTYNTLTFSALVDRDNFPASDIAVGQLFSVGAESFASVTTSAPSTTDQSWTMTAYKVTDSGKTLNSNVTPDQNTMPITGTPPTSGTPILVGGEWMTVTGGATGSWAVTRGTPQAATWAVLGAYPHYQYDTVYTVTTTGLSGSYVKGQSVIEGYNVSTPIVGTARLGY